MDPEQLIFPFVMAVITSSIMFVIVYFLRKIPFFSNLFSVWFMVLLYLFCILRVFLPIEFPGIQIKLEDNTVYAGVFDHLIVYDDVHSLSRPSVIAWILIGIWIAGALALGVRSLIVQRNFKRYLFANGDYSSDEERALFLETAKDVLRSDKHVSLRKTDAINGTVVIGLFRQTVLIPDEAYKSGELRMIFRHECMHIKDKDLWIKLLVQIYCCLFWWNPFVYLLKKDLDLSLEMRCDLNTTENFSDEEKLLYVETLKRHGAPEKQKTPFVVSAGLSDGKKKDKLLTRIKKLLAVPPNKAKQTAIHATAAALILLVFSSSFVFIWQPSFRQDKLEVEYYELAEGGEIVDGSMAYLVRCNDGNYLFYYSNYLPVPATKEEVDQGLYKDYPIYDE